MNNHNHILIVEDEPAIADTLDYVLRGEGFSTHCVHIGQDALDELQNPSGQPYVLVILDIGLPDMSGFDVCRVLRRFSDVPVIFLTARTEEVDRIVGLELGADDYVPKPFSPREVASRVRAILRRARGATADNHLAAKNETAAAVFEHDAAGFRIAYHGVWLTLTRYEYGVLAALIERPGRVLSRMQLMERVWFDHEESLERTVDAHIKTLRAKLRNVFPDEEVIETHRGLGYSIKRPSS